MAIQNKVSLYRDVKFNKKPTLHLTEKAQDEILEQEPTPAYIENENRIKSQPRDPLQNRGDSLAPIQRSRRSMILLQ